MKFKENTLKRFALPLSETENDKCLNAIKMVRDALRDLGLTDDNQAIVPLYEDTYAYAVEMRSGSTGRKIKIFIQGSYANNTNVRTQSDVDIAVVQENIFQTEYRTSYCPQKDADYGFTPASETAAEFKDAVQMCLTRKFGTDVERKDKSIKVHGNTNRKDADTVPCRRYRDYRKDFSNNADNYVGGIVIYTDSGERIINFPEQHITNGRKKNNDTKHYYKKMVRIIKTIRHEMSEYGYSSADKVSSFGLESLLWNIPNEVYTKYSLHGLVFQEVLDHLHNNKGKLAGYKEANGIKPLCPTTSEVTAYSEFIDDIKKFFEYDWTV